MNPALEQEEINIVAQGNRAGKSILLENQELKRLLSEAERLIEDVYQGHRNPDDGGNYNWCDEELCQWCEDALALFPNLDKKIT